MALRERSIFHWSMGWAAVWLLPPLYALVNNRGVVSHSDGTAMLLSNGGDVKIFDIKNKTVVWYVRNKTRIAHLLEAHGTLGKHVPVPELALLQTGDGFRESLVTGEPVYLASKEMQYYAYRTILLGLTQLVEDNLSSARGYTWAKRLYDEAIELTSRLPINNLLESRQSAIIEFLASAGFSPSHGDLNHSNVLLEGDRPVIIDLEHFGNRPFFYDALGFPLSNAHKGSHYILHATLNGAFDGELDALFSVAGMERFSADRVVPFLSFLVANLHEAAARSRLDKARIQRWCFPLERLFSAGTIPD